MKRYRVAYERDESGWWVASVRGVRGCHTQGRTVDEARRRIREALALFVDDARKATIADNVSAERRDTGDSGLRDSSKESRRRRPTRGPRGSTRRPGFANRKTENRFFKIRAGQCRQGHTGS